MKLGLIVATRVYDKMHSSDYHGPLCKKRNGFVLLKLHPYLEIQDAECSRIVNNLNYLFIYFG